MNAAIWLGSAVFSTLGASRALSSEAMRELLGARHFPYFSGAIAELVAGRFWQLHIACALVALLHLSAESLYFGRGFRKPWLILLLALFCVGAVEVAWLQPKSHRLHLVAHAVNRPLPVRQQAAASYRTWNTVSHGLEFMMILGLSAYLWRIANPLDPTRFLTPGKYRS